MRYRLTVGLAVLLADLAGDVAAAGLEEGPLDVGRVRFSRLSGELEIQVTPSAEGATLRLDGPDALVAAVERQTDGGTLRVIGPPQGATASTVAVAQTGITVGLGMRSNQIVISGQPVAMEPLHVTVAIPPGVAIQIEGFVGGVVVGDTRASIELELLSGEARIGVVSDADLTVDGAGGIAVDRVEGELAARVDGSGSITVADAALGDLHVRVNGVGDVRIGGRAETADLGLDGVGSIRVAEVEQRPRVRVNGIGAIEVGSW
jgi:hypothetical protein